MMGIIVLLIFVFVAFSVVDWAMKSVVPPPVETKVKKCPPHGWVYGADEKLVCTQCGKRPGEFTTGNGEY